MDFSALEEAMASKSYNEIADTCDALMLQVASEGVSYHDEWPYAVHLLGHIYNNDINSARFLWKICQKLWIKDYGGVHEAMREFNWSPTSQGVVAAFSELHTKRMF